MNKPKRSEVWLADLSMAAKVRPVLVMSVPYGDADYALIGVVPHTSTPRGAQFEVSLPVRFLKPGAFNIQGMLAVPAAKFRRKVGTLAVTIQRVARRTRRPRRRSRIPAPYPSNMKRSLFSEC